MFQTLLACILGVSLVSPAQSLYYRPSPSIFDVWDRQLVIDLNFTSVIPTSFVVQSDNITSFLNVSGTVANLTIPLSTGFHGQLTAPICERYASEVNCLTQDHGYIIGFTFVPDTVQLHVSEEHLDIHGWRALEAVVTYVVLISVVLGLLGLGLYSWHLFVEPRFHRSEAFDARYHRMQND